MEEEKELSQTDEERRSHWADEATKSLVDCHIASTPWNLPDPTNALLLHLHYYTYRSVAARNHVAA